MASSRGPGKVSAEQFLRRVADPSQGDVDAELCSAIMVYLIAERQEGASIGELSALTLRGRKPTEEVEQVSAAVSRLEQEGEVTTDGRLVVPVLQPSREDHDAGGRNGV